MATESEKRAAELAVLRYGADPARVKSAWQATHQTPANGTGGDVLATLVAEKILTPAQADVLRLDLQTTHLALPEETPNSGAAGANGDQDLPPTRSGHHLRLIAGYRLLRRLGEGGMGSVYLGFKEGQDYPVAIKVLADNLAGNPAYLSRFQREASSGLKLDHPNIVHCIAAGEDPVAGKHYLVLEYVDGPSAHELLDRYKRLAVRDAISIGLDIARALEYIHSRNFVHRDIKPDNILLTRSGVAKLADLGLAKCRDEANPLTVMRQGFGTPFYMPHEQAVNARQADARSDIYALGATLYHLLTGEVPFNGNNPIALTEKKLSGDFTPASVVNPEVPPALDRILKKMLAPKPEDRYQMASQLIVELDRSKLAAPVPSFADADLALQDPVVRKRLAAPPQPTQLDMLTPRPAAVQSNGPTDAWYVRFRSQDGQVCKTKVPRQQVVQRLQTGQLPLDAQACRESQGDFIAIAEIPDFQEALPTPRPSNGQRTVDAGTNGKPKTSPGLKQSTASVPSFGAMFWAILTVLALISAAVLAYLGLQ